ncbi:MAG: flagellar basal body-associated FliL family protein [Phycisphaerae bacterium]|nr:flagellar basal body-associated FliL family protein [Phycisphaerae bacterium]
MLRVLQYGTLRTGAIAVAILAAGCAGEPGWGVDWSAFGAEPPAATYVRLGEIRTNARTPSLDRRVEAVIDIGLAEEDRAAAHLVETQAPVLRNAAILYFADQPPTALRGEDGRRRAAADLRQRFNAALPQAIVRAVRFQKLLVN